jgi:hypothetical protein
MDKLNSMITVTGQMRGESWKGNSINKDKEVKNPMTMKKCVSILIMLIFVGVILLNSSCQTGLNLKTEPKKPGKINEDTTNNKTTSTTPSTAKKSTDKKSTDSLHAVQCKGYTKEGKRCKRKTTDPSGYCWQHKKN